MTPFERYVRSELGSSVFDSEDGSDEAQLFQVSLASARNLMRWTDGTADARGQPFRFDSGYIERMTPNALAGHADEGVHILGMHQALFVTMQEFAAFCFAQSGFMTDIGEAALEVSPAPYDDRAPGLWLLDRTESGMRSVPKDAGRIMPRCPLRGVAAVYLGQLMARSVWLHELAHCTCGHVIKAKADGIAPRLYEVAEPDLGIVGFALEDAIADKDRFVRLQAYEYEADRMALSGAIRIQTGGMENIDDIAAMPLRQRVQLTLFGALVMTWLFDRYQDHTGAHDDWTHPKPADRCDRLVRWVDGDLVPTTPGLNELLVDTARQFDAIRERVPSLYRLELRPR